MRKNNLTSLLSALMLLPILLAVTSCQSGSALPPSCLDYRYLGEDKEAVTQIVDFGNAAPQVEDKQETYTISQVISDDELKWDKESIEISYTFYNNVLAAYECNFDNIDAAYNYAKHVREDLEATFGKKTTYPGISATDRDYFDNITDVSELKEQYTYYEDWTPDTDEEQMKKIFGDTEYSRIDIRFELKIFSDETASVSVKYLALP